jgi:hypothetical protein
MYYKAIQTISDWRADRGAGGFLTDRTSSPARWGQMIYVHTGQQTGHLKEQYVCKLKAVQSNIISQIKGIVQRG